MIQIHVNGRETVMRSINNKVNINAKMLENE